MANSAFLLSSRVFFMEKVWRSFFTKPRGKSRTRNWSHTVSWSFRTADSTAYSRGNQRDNIPTLIRATQMTAHPLKRGRFKYSEDDLRSKGHPRRRFKCDVTSDIFGLGTGTLPSLPWPTKGPRNDSGNAQQRLSHSRGPMERKAKQGLQSG